MTNSKFIIVLFSLIFLIYACGKEKMKDNEDKLSNFQIHFGSFGGLCGYSDSLTVSSTLELYFAQRNICSEIDIEKNETISKDQLSALISSVDLDQFDDLDFNSCDRCFDGIDTYINIESPEYRHRIQYGSGDNISSIISFIDKLNELRDDYREE